MKWQSNDIAVIYSKVTKLKGLLTILIEFASLFLSWISLELEHPALSFPNISIVSYQNWGYPTDNSELRT